VQLHKIRDMLICFHLNFSGTLQSPRAVHYKSLYSVSCDTVTLIRIISVNIIKGLVFIMDSVSLELQLDFFM